MDSWTIRCSIFKSLEYLIWYLAGGLPLHVFMITQYVMLLVRPFCSNPLVNSPLKLSMHNLEVLLSIVFFRILKNVVFISNIQPFWHLAISRQKRTIGLT